MEKKVYALRKDLPKDKINLFFQGKRISVECSALRKQYEAISEKRRLTLYPLQIYLEEKGFSGARFGKTLAYFTSSYVPSFNVIMSQVADKLPKKYINTLQKTYDSLSGCGNRYLTFRIKQIRQEKGKKA